MRPNRTMSVNEAVSVTIDYRESGFFRGFGKDRFITPRRVPKESKEPSRVTRFTKPAIQVRPRKAPIEALE
jgi:hypothetical protein